MNVLVSAPEPSTIEQMKAAFAGRIGVTVEACSSVDVVDVSERRRPDVVLLDESVIRDHRDLVGQIHQVAPSSAVLVFVEGVETATAAPGRSHAMQELVDVLSDELLTPVTVLQGVAQTVARRPELSDEQVREMAESAQRASGQLRRLVENVALASLIRQGELRLDRRVVSTAQFLSRVLERFPGVLRLRPWPGQADRHFEADLDLLLRATVALTENALAFSPETEPVDLELAGEGDLIEIIVRDRGPGIDEDLRPQVFELFVRAHVGDARLKRGMGIGLYVAQHIVRAHGGRIDITAAPDNNEVVLQLPASGRA